MGKIIKIVLTALLLTLSSCYVDPNGIAHYDYINNSGYDIVMEQYYIDELIDAQTILVDGSTRMTFEDLGDCPNPFRMTETVKIIFNNERVLVYDTSYKGLFNQKYYTEVPSGKKYTKIFEWTFTPEDYELATPIEPVNP